MVYSRCIYRESKRNDFTEITIDVVCCYCTENTNLDCDRVHYLRTSPPETELGILSIEINECEHFCVTARPRSHIKQLVLVTLDNH